MSSVFSPLERFGILVVNRQIAPGRVFQIVHAGMRLPFDPFLADRRKKALPQIQLRRCGGNRHDSVASLPTRSSLCRSCGCHNCPYEVNIQARWHVPVDGIE